MPRDCYSLYYSAAALLANSHQCNALAFPKSVSETVHARSWGPRGMGSVARGREIAPPFRSSPRHRSAGHPRTDTAPENFRGSLERTQ